MLCRRCEGVERGGAGHPAGASPAAVWGVERLRGLMCAACGALLGAEDIAQRLLRKHSQLAQFGLVSLSRPPRRPLRLEED